MMLANGVPYIVAIPIACAKPSSDGRTCGLFKPSQGQQMKLLHENARGSLPTVSFLALTVLLPTVNRYQMGNLELNMRFNNTEFPIPSTTRLLLCRRLANCAGLSKQETKAQDFGYSTGLNNMFLAHAAQVLAFAHQYWDKDLRYLKDSDYQRRFPINQRYSQDKVIATSFHSTT
ncbi:unnamed protein product [Fusarium graminearum]|nr:unnamed protein product [Fusarium graminearum]CAG1972807.1 unnamed protein product [Fusarium graminearum]CAG1973527.1 unnamed protein product [Fusarium graminearum]VTO87986.1 unnamed protein product [Fusarium graminearum]